MRGFRLAVVAAVILSGGLVASAATPEQLFLGVLRKFGISDSVNASQKPCLCSGGLVGGLAGRLEALKVTSGVLSGGYQFDCRVNLFNPDGSIGSSGACIANGGSITVIGR